jgi:hypothetical protein
MRLVDDESVEENRETSDVFLGLAVRNETVSVVTPNIKELHHARDHGHA